MRYKVFVSNGHDYRNFYLDNEPQADLLFDMAVNSGMFAYVYLAEVTEECFLKKEWAEEDEEHEGF